MCVYVNVCEFIAYSVQPVRSPDSRLIVAAFARAPRARVQCEHEIFVRHIVSRFVFRVQCSVFALLSGRPDLPPTAERRRRHIVQVRMCACGGNTLLHARAHCRCRPRIYTHFTHVAFGWRAFSAAARHNQTKKEEMHIGGCRRSTRWRPNRLEPLCSALPCVAREEQLIIWRARVRARAARRVLDADKPCVCVRACVCLA